MSLENDLAYSIAYSMALNESCAILDNLAVFMRYVSRHLCVKEELLELVAHKDTAK